MNTLVVSLFGGPSAGKSTERAALYAALKRQHISCEEATEFAKDVIWDGATSYLDNQIYIFAHQHQRIKRLLGKVQVVITDSPLLLSIHYGTKESATFRQLVLEEHNKLHNLNIFLVRSATAPYDAGGRMQSSREDAEQIDYQIRSLLQTSGVHYLELPVGHTDILVEQVKLEFDNVNRDAIEPRELLPLSVQTTLSAVGDSEKVQA